MYNHSTKNDRCQQVWRPRNEQYNIVNMFPNHWVWWGQPVSGMPLGFKLCLYRWSYRLQKLPHVSKRLVSHMHPPSKKRNWCSMFSHPTSLKRKKKIGVPHEISKHVSGSHSNREFVGTVLKWVYDRCHQTWSENWNDIPRFLFYEVLWLVIIPGGGLNR